ncbi:hypothetical protein E2C01_027128 [Portunus trituberculatus]|uniref:Uncharacterized protein n=1 Tax=Portunus trituberculatus TaxID=210409 RepID=A0A5B7EKI6_PORTR|nr:hypothetical protein [Portunus trituberculatus]
MRTAAVTLPGSRGQLSLAPIGRYSDRLGAAGPIRNALQEADQSRGLEGWLMVPPLPSTAPPTRLAAPPT